MNLTAFAGSFSERPRFSVKKEQGRQWIHSIVVGPGLEQTADLDTNAPLGAYNPIGYSAFRLSKASFARCFIISDSTSKPRER